jgi:lipoyl(octanoyl) transferase
VRWKITDQLVPYEEATAYMEKRIAEIKQGDAEEVWLLEHPPLITAGTSAKPQDLIDHRFPLFEAGRGGQYTYHGPGQRIAYVMLDLNRRKPDLRAFVQTLEQWVINALWQYHLRGFTAKDRIGVWVEKGEGYEDKIAAIGLRVRSWVTWHGLSFNIDPNLSHFNAINPCGNVDQRFGVTSLHALGYTVSLAEVDMVLRAEFEKLFGETKTTLPF